MLFNSLLKKVKRDVKSALHTSAINYVSHNGDKGISALASELHTKEKTFRTKLDKNFSDSTPSLDDILNIVFETGDTSAIRQLCTLADKVDGIMGVKRSAFDLMNDLQVTASETIKEIHSSAADGVISEHERATLQTTYKNLRDAIDLAESSLQVGKVTQI